MGFVWLKSVRPHNWRLCICGALCARDSNPDLAWENACAGKVSFTVTVDKEGTHRDWRGLLFTRPEVYIQIFSLLHSSFCLRLRSSSHKFLISQALPLQLFLLPSLGSAIQHFCASSRCHNMRWEWYTFSVQG